MKENISTINYLLKTAKWLIPAIAFIFIMSALFSEIQKGVEDIEKNKGKEKESEIKIIEENLKGDKDLIEKAKDEIKEPEVLIPKKEEVKEVEVLLPEGTDRFIVYLNTDNSVVSDNLDSGDYLKDKNKFLSILESDKKEIMPGAYKISKEMTNEQLVKVFSGAPYMKWVTIKPGLRKEEIAEILSTNLGWNNTQKNDWINKDTVISPEYTEGVYYPDTYLIPTEEEPALVAKRLINKFNEKFSDYLSQFTFKNIKWARALTLASIVQREASNNQDMPLIAGILWNRLEQNMALGVDATLQYLRGDKGNGWWAPISVSEKLIDSPFNTYKYKGLPPHPISNPGIAAIEAVLNPVETECMYYIHDKNRNTHCAVTYEEHILNIQKYLIGE